MNENIQVMRPRLARCDSLDAFNVLPHLLILVMCLIPEVWSLGDVQNVFWGVSALSDGDTLVVVGGVMGGMMGRGGEGTKRIYPRHTFQPLALSCTAS